MTDRTTPNFERTASALHKFVVDFRCIAPFLNTANQMDWVQPNFGLLPPPLCVKIMAGMSEVSQYFKLSLVPTTDAVGAGPLHRLGN